VLRGTYAIVLRSQTLGPVRIGKLGTLRLQEGFYIYVGSAFGPGGLQARIQHHLQRARRPHWHIDYLRAACDVVESGQRP
jgi:Uri superfamily endonuclease